MVSTLSFVINKTYNMSQEIWGLPSHYQSLFAQIIYGEWLWICLWNFYYSLFDMHKIYYYKNKIQLCFQRESYLIHMSIMYDQREKLNNSTHYITFYQLKCHNVFYKPCSSKTLIIILSQVTKLYFILQLSYSLLIRLLTL